jgi:hypothetical protein
MLAYNGSIPGQLLRVAQGSEITVTNNAGLEQTVHWHGLRLDNRYDGVPYQTQQPISVLGVFTHPLQSACTDTTRTSARTTPRRWACTAAGLVPHQAGQLVVSSAKIPSWVQAV